MEKGSSEVGTGEDRFVLDIACRPAALADARQRFEGWLSGQAADEEARDELAIVMSELGANAVAAAAGDQGQIAVRAWRDGGDVVLEVENVPVGCSRPFVPEHDADPLRASGRGLLIVEAYTDAMEVLAADGGRGLTVRCRKRVSRAAGHRRDGQVAH